MAAIFLASVGAAMLCYMIPEFLAAMVKCSQPLTLNLICSLGGALLTAGLMLQGV